MFYNIFIIVFKVLDDDRHPYQGLEGAEGVVLVSVALGPAEAVGHEEEVGEPLHVLGGQPQRVVEAGLGLVEVDAAEHDLLVLVLVVRVLTALSQPSLSPLSALSKPPLSCLLALSQLSLELSFSFFTKENIALFLTFYKGKHSPILDFLQRKT